jgi:hypothetical protein
MRRERYNIYEKAHSKLRRQLLDAGLAVQAADFGKKADASYVFERINKTNSTVYQYLGQTTLILEAIVSMAPYIVIELEKGNSAIKELVAKMEQLQDQYGQSYTLSLKKKIGNEVQQLFFELTAASLKMMNREEMIINDLLWTSYTDNEIIELESRITSPSFKIDINEVEAIEKSEVSEYSAISWKITPLISFNNILPGSEKLASLIRTLLAPGKWSFANRVYNIIRPHHLFGMIPAIITCSLLPVLSA